MPPTKGQPTASALPPEVQELASKTRPKWEPRHRAPARQAGDVLPYVVTITPEEAADILKWRNPHNRVPRLRVARMIARDILADEFDQNGESIKFEIDTGFLLDGQTRLLACVFARIPIRVVVVEGVFRRGQATMDAGTQRSVSDDLKIYKESNTAVLGGLLLRVATWDWCLKEYGAGNYVGRVNYKPSKRQQLELLYDGGSPGKDAVDATLMRYATKRGQSIYQSIGIPQSCWAFCFYECAKLNRPEADEFFKRMEKGTNVGPNAPHVLRETLIHKRNKEQRTSAAYQKTPESLYAALIILGWNRYAHGLVTHKLNFRAGGANPEHFPQFEMPQ